MNSQNDAKNSHFGLILVLVIVTLFCVLGYALFSRKSNGLPDNQGESVATSPEEAVVPGEDVTMPRSGGVIKDNDGKTVVSGAIVEMIQKKGLEGKWIKVSVADSRNTMDKASSPENKGEAMPAPIFKNYLFFLSDKDTAGAADIKGSGIVTITFQGDPSEKDYVLAEKVEVSTALSR